MKNRNYLTGLLLKQGTAYIFNKALGDVPANEPPSVPGPLSTP